LFPDDAFGLFILLTDIAYSVRHAERYSNIRPHFDSFPAALPAVLLPFGLVPTTFEQYYFLRWTLHTLLTALYAACVALCCRYRYALYRLPLLLLAVTRFKGRRFEQWFVDDAPSRHGCVVTPLRSYY